MNQGSDPEKERKKPKTYHRDELFLKLGLFRRDVFDSVGDYAARTTPGTIPYELFDGLKRDLEIKIDKRMNDMEKYWKEHSELSSRVARIEGQTEDKKFRFSNRRILLIAIIGWIIVTISIILSNFDSILSYIFPS